MDSWLQNLKSACEKSSQREVASKIGYSPATISLVLKGNYRGDIDAVENAVRKKLMCDSVSCPVLGEISPAQCSGHQGRPFSSSSSVRVRLHKACRKCPFNTKKKERS